MTLPLKVSMPRVVLVELLGQAACGAGDCSALLVGSTRRRRCPTRMVDDGDNYNEQGVGAAAEETTITVHEVVPVPYTGHDNGGAARRGDLCDDAGRLNENFLEGAVRRDVGGSSQDDIGSAATVVGWVSIRRGAPMRPSLRERLVQRKLMEWVAKRAGDGNESSAAGSVLFGIVGTKQNGARSIMSFTHRFFTSAAFVPVSVEVLSRPAGSVAEYASFRGTSVLPSAAASASMTTASASSLSWASLGFGGGAGGGGAGSSGDGDIAKGYLATLEGGAQAVVALVEEKVAELAALEARIAKAEEAPTPPRSKVAPS